MTRWLFAGPDDELSRRIVAHLGCRFVPARALGARGGAGTGGAPSAAVDDYAAAFAAMGESNAAQPALDAVV
ncbi:MAG TPA: hypothetical protein VE075_05125, partial [Thermoanaerobaculia bacterium]|nr:hypothetical protein [Thermoanaerobaculia bacterium]